MNQVGATLKNLNFVLIIVKSKENIEGGVGVKQ